MCLSIQWMFCDTMNKRGIGGYISYSCCYSKNHLITHKFDCLRNMASKWIISKKKKYNNFNFQMKSNLKNYFVLLFFFICYIEIYFVILVSVIFKFIIVIFHKLLFLLPPTACNGYICRNIQVYRVLNNKLLYPKTMFWCYGFHEKLKQRQKCSSKNCFFNENVMVGKLVKFP